MDLRLATDIMFFRQIQQPFRNGFKNTPNDEAWGGTLSMNSRVKILRIPFALP